MGVANKAADTERTWLVAQAHRDGSYPRKSR